MSSKERRWYMNELIMPHNAGVKRVLESMKEVLALYKNVTGCYRALVTRSFPVLPYIYGRILALASVLTKRLALILQNPLFFTSFFRRSTLASLAFCKNIANNWRSYSVSTKKETSFFVLCSTFRNFAAIRTSFAHHHGVGNVATKPLRN